MTTVLSVKAGRCFRQGSTSTVVPSRDKGNVVIQIQDGLAHLMYRSRPSDSLQDDYILFPGDAECHVVPSTQSRVFELRFGQSTHHFFYLQTAHADTFLERFCQRVNEIVVDPEGAHALPTLEDNVPSTSSAPPEMNTPATHLDAATLGQLFGGAPGRPADQARMRQLLSHLATQTPSRPATTSSQPPPSQSIPTQPSQPSQPSQPPASLSTVPALPEHAEEDTELLSLFTPQNLEPILSNPALLHSLFPHLPPDLPQPHDRSAVERLIASVPFRQSVRHLQAALASGALGPLMQSLGLPAAAAHNGVRGFIEAIVAQARQTNGGTG